MKEGYLSSELIQDSLAEVKHFKPEHNGKDRFGNRLFTSEEFSYLDGSGEKVKAGLLISVHGQKLIKENPGILRDIERGLAACELREGKGDETINLGHERSLKLLTTRGGQSVVYILEVESEKYVIKIHKPSESGEPDFHQPYINEMLQTQSLAKDLKRELDDLGVKLSEFLFASGQISCTRYEDDVKNYDALDVERLKDLKVAVLGYLIERRQEHDPLWDNINIDLNPGTPKGAFQALLNFRTKKDGVIVWIDPFIYQRPEKR